MNTEEASFRRQVWRHYRAHGRHDLPWRKTHDPYKILVSEVMLQQTQVDRVIPFYKSFIKRFPTAQKLAAAPLSDVLKLWQGLGYNRRAKMLHQAAKEIDARGMPHDVQGLETLPGVGPYTARAVAAFAYNQDGLVIETNIRTAVIHHFFDRNTAIYGSVSDKEIEEVLAKVLPNGRARPVRDRNSKSSGSSKTSVSNGAREWYSALMDYGAHLKRSGISHNARSAAHARQSRFSGSLREARGAIVRELVAKSATRTHLVKMLGEERQEQMARALERMAVEGLVCRKGTRYALPG